MIKSDIKLSILEMLQEESIFYMCQDKLGNWYFMSTGDMTTGVGLTKEQLIKLGYELIYLGGGLKREEIIELGNKNG